jgi:hypothetical protein
MATHHDICLCFALQAEVSVLVRAIKARDEMLCMREQELRLLQNKCGHAKATQGRERMPAGIHEGLESPQEDGAHFLEVRKSSGALYHTRDSAEVSMHKCHLCLCVSRNLEEKLLLGMRMYFLFEKNLVSSSCATYTLSPTGSWEGLVGGADDTALHRLSEALPPVNRARAIGMSAEEK